MPEERLATLLSSRAVKMLEELVQCGFFSTKGEAVEAGILRLGEDYGLTSPATPPRRTAELRPPVDRAVYDKVLGVLSQMEQGS